MKSAPDWIVALRAAAKRKTMTQVAKDLGYSKTMISLVIAGKYRRGTDTIEKRVRARLMLQSSWQFRALDSDAHARLTELVATWNLEIVGGMYGVPQRTLRRHLAGTSKTSAASFVNRVRARGFPTPEFCVECTQLTNAAHKVVAP